MPIANRLAARDGFIMASLLKPWIKQAILDHLKTDTQHRYILSENQQYLVSVQDWQINAPAQLIRYISKDVPDAKSGIEVEVSDKRFYLRVELTREAIWLHDR